ncbi:MAG: DNA-3-methyladenine glycosylase I [Planctomycetes bacterium]|nr:DNA-3-methyladenine glycosylase I [Planctomycetota bacterium]
MSIAQSRCQWCGEDELYIRYHDEEWGVPVHDDRRLFEFLVLEGAQAGLSWLTILRKRENYRAAFAAFDPAKVARYGEKQVAALLANPGIVRNRLKIRAAIRNANLFMDTAARHGSFATFLWNFVDGTVVRNAWRRQEEIPATSPVSDTISKEMKRLGFSFVGSTIIYAHMQATGMVNDHLVSCFRYHEVGA